MGHAARSTLTTSTTSQSNRTSIDSTRHLTPASFTKIWSKFTLSNSRNLLIYPKRSFPSNPSLWPLMRASQRLKANYPLSSLYLKSLNHPYIQMRPPLSRWKERFSKHLKIMIRKRSIKKSLKSKRSRSHPRNHPRPLNLTITNLLFMWATCYRIV